MKVGDKVIVREEGPWIDMEGVVTALPAAELRGPGFDISVREDLQTVEVAILGGALGIFVHPRDLELKN